MDVESFVSLLGVDSRRDGRDYLITCPFHNDHKPSLRVYGGNSHDGYNCFACGANGTWAHLYKEIKGCEWKEAYDVLGIEGDYKSESKPAPIRFDFVDPENPAFVKEIQKRYEQCLLLDSPEAEPVVKFLEKKHLLDQAKELGWRFDTGVFLQSKPRGALVIPYREEGKIISCRLRTIETDGSISKPKSLKGTHARPFVLLQDGKDIDVLYICEGETDALSLYASGCSVVAVPGAGQKKCINTAVLYCELTGARTIVSCGDNDGPGRMMNELAQAASHALTTATFSTLPPEALGGLNDINDAYVAGKLDLYGSTIESLFPGAAPLSGWDELMAQVQFSTKDEAYELVSVACSKAAEEHPEDLDFLTDLYADSMEELKTAWVKGSYTQQVRYETLKDIMKTILAPAPPPRQQSLLDKQNYGS